MVDTTINRQASMEVTLESQTQLVSRLGLAIKNSSKLSFLHGGVGVGKSHVANLLKNSLTNMHVVRLQLKSAIEPEQLKEQIVCELATGELSDLNQPISAAVNDGILHNRVSTLLIIDNAELIPQQTLSALWQSLHEVTRMNQTNCTFNVLLIGDTRWALPMHHGLMNNKADSLAAEFLISALTVQQATDFMMRVHVDWSEQKIREFIKKVSPEYLIPKQLIYAQIPLSQRYKRKVSIFIATLLLVIASVAVFAKYYLVNELNTLKNASNDNAPAIISSIKDPVIVPVTRKNIPVILLPETITEMDITSPEEMTNIDTSVIEETVIKKPIEASTIAQEKLIEKPKDEVIERETEAPSTVQEQLIVKPKEIVDVKDKIINAFNFDGQYLSELPDKGYSLMIGGYSSHQTLLAVRARFKIQKDLKQYQTIRNKQPWFVLLYGKFETLNQANTFVKDNDSIFSKFSPWAKPYKSIKKEVYLGQLSKNNKKEHND